MIRKKALLFTAAVCLSVMLSGCADISFGEATMMRPPRATGDRAEIQSIIDELAGSGYNLKYPQKGEYRSAITVFDPDKQNEFAVAFFATENDSKLNVAFITGSDGKWKSLECFSATGTGVDRVIYDDINNDGKNEIIVGWNGYSTGRNTLSAYSISDDAAFEMKTDGYYSDLVIDDITDSGTKDLIFLTLRGSDQSLSTATVLQYSDQEKRPIAKYAVDLDPEISAFSSISVGYVDEKTKGILIDGQKSGGILTTQLVCFDSLHNSLINPLVTVSESGAVTNPTSRKDLITCRDIDNDRIIEIPVISQMSASSDSNAGSVCTLTSWMQYDIKKAQLSPKLYTVLNYTDGYYFIMPTRWAGNVTAISDPENRSIVFFLWNEKTASFGDKLLTIRRFTGTEWNSEQHSSFVQLETLTDGSESVIAAEIFHTDSKDVMNTTEKEITGSLKLLSKN